MQNISDFTDGGTQSMLRVRDLEMEGGREGGWRQAVAPGRTSCVGGTVGLSVELRHWTYTATR